MLMSSLTRRMFMFRVLPTPLQRRPVHGSRREMCSRSGGTRAGSIVRSRIISSRLTAWLDHGAPLEISGRQFDAVSISVNHARATPGERRCLRILMIAYACTPARGGEHLLGWEWAARLAKIHEVTVLTSAERLKESDGQRPSSLRMLRAPDRAILPVKRAGSFGWHLYYLLWHVAATRLARRLLTRERFDIVHQCPLHTVRVPARLWGGNMPPFIWGPVAGFEQIPFKMIGALGPGSFLELTRLIGNRIFRASHRSGAPPTTPRRSWCPITTRCAGLSSRIARSSSICRQMPFS